LGRTDQSVIDPNPVIWNPKEIFEKDWLEPSAVAKTAFGFAPLTLGHFGKIAQKNGVAPHLGRSSRLFPEENER
jgi:hypothetical protein